MHMKVDAVPVKAIKSDLLLSSTAFGSITVRIVLRISAPGSSSLCPRLIRTSTSVCFKAAALISAQTRSGTGGVEGLL